MEKKDANVPLSSNTNNQSGIGKALLYGFPTGVVFGFALEKSKVYLPEIIRSQMRFESFTMLKMFLAAMATSTIAVAALSEMRLITRKPRHPISLFDANTPKSEGILSALKRYSGNFLGGGLLGIGMTLAGACPGTVFVQLGTGIPAASYILMGGLGGALLYSIYDSCYPLQTCTAPSTSPAVAPQGAAPSSQQIHHHQHGKPSDIPTIDRLLGISHLSTALFLSLGVGALIYGVENLVPWKIDLSRQLPGIFGGFNGFSNTVRSLLAAPAWSPIWSGVLVGLLQVPSLLLFNVQLGTSSSFVWLISQTSSLISSTLHSKMPYLARFRSSLDYWQVALVGGMILGGYLSSSLAASTPALAAVPLSAFSKGVMTLGGVLLVFGARMAGGCTSGHGLSGFSQLSLASAASVVSMFGAGMATAQLVTL